MEQYQQMNPQECAARTGIPYDEETKCFRMRMLQKEYLISWPELNVTLADAQDTSYAALVQETPAKILALRFFVAWGIVAVNRKIFSPIARSRAARSTSVSFPADVSREWLTDSASSRRN